MNWWKRFFGVDLFDTVVHVGITLAVMVVVAEESRQPEPVSISARPSTRVWAMSMRGASASTAGSSE